ncbi:hypothetical protein NDU88_003589 [Pleurodeles waltl]|uniref:Uncharacterized protein n=1 Tax=Pleurodeles waltl TaxID=8319 RepID=A0AAV7PCN9_PLEWA|nr:hypothetical protein NDU88_003589 [Pleurodeles waltl]
MQHGIPSAAGDCFLQSDATTQRLPTGANSRAESQLLQGTAYQATRPRSNRCQTQSSTLVSIKKADWQRAPALKLSYLRGTAYQATRPRSNLRQAPSSTLVSTKKGGVPELPRLRGTAFSSDATPQSHPTDNELQHARQS